MTTDGASAHIRWTADQGMQGTVVAREGHTFHEGDTSKLRDPSDGACGSLAGDGGVNLRPAFREKGAVRRHGAADLVPCLP